MVGGDLHLGYESRPDSALLLDESPNWEQPRAWPFYSYWTDFDPEYVYRNSSDSKGFEDLFMVPTLSYAHVSRASEVSDSDDYNPDTIYRNSRYFVQVDGCTYSGARTTETQLTLSSLAPPDLVTPNEAGEVPPRLTCMDGERAARELRRAWYNVTSRRASDESILILLSHWAHETSSGTVMFNYNFAGIKGRSDGGLSCLREAHEGWGNRTQVGIDRFRAYLSASEGAEDYVSLLARKYPNAVNAAQVGDVLQFVAALKQGGYFTGSDSAYAQSLVELAERGKRWGYNALRTGAPRRSATASTSSRIARLQRRSFVP